MSYGSWRMRLAVAQEACGVTYDAHDLRHVAASIPYVAGRGCARFKRRSATPPSAPRRASTGTWSRSTAPKWRRVPAKQAALTAAEIAAAEAAAAAEGAPTLRDLGGADDQ